MTDKLTPGRAVRLLRAKADELENRTSVLLNSVPQDSSVLSKDLAYLSADIALIASLLADHLDGEATQRGRVWRDARFEMPE